MERLGRPDPRFSPAYDPRLIEAIYDALQPMQSRKH